MKNKFTLVINRYLQIYKAIEERGWTCWKDVPTGTISGNFLKEFGFVPGMANDTKAIIWHISYHIFFLSSQKIHLFWKCPSDTQMTDFNDSIVK